MNMIDTNYGSAGAPVTLPQLRGPYAVARGQELPIPPLAKTIVSLSAAALSGYHGARRNGGSLFWGLIWFSFGAAFPLATPVFAAAQGFGECKNNCRVGHTVNLGRRRRR
jgi:hypothetical protein